MNHILALFISSLFINLSYAQDLPSALVHKLIGTVLLDGAPLKQGDVIEKPGTIEVKDKSLVQLKIAKWNNGITIGPKSKMVLNFNDEKKYSLESGLCRWRSELRDALQKEAKGKIYTKQVALGVRGTDFTLKVNPVLGESEIVMFDGSVEMKNLDDAANTVIVNKGQWGGVGGRFGKKIAPPLDLSPEILKSFDKLIEAP